MSVNVCEITLISEIMSGSGGSVSSGPATSNALKKSIGRIIINIRAILPQLKRLSKPKLILMMT